MSVRLYYIIYCDLIFGIRLKYLRHRLNMHHIYNLTMYTWIYNVINGCGAMKTNY